VTSAGQALTVAAGAVTIPRLGHMPVPVAVRSVAVRAKPCIVVKPGRVDLGEAIGEAGCLADPLGQYNNMSK
jgi:hypothetical protein